MRILVDADACPVIDITEEIAQIYNIKLILFFDICHNITSDYANLIRVDKQNQSVDMNLYNRCKKDDIVITQDYGLAALVLGKKARVITPYGKIINDNNIDHLLMRKHIHAKIRKAGGRHSTHKKRRASHDKQFKKTLNYLVNIQLKKYDT